MKINRRTLDDIHIYDVVGILDSSTSPDAQDIIQQSLDQGCTRIILNLEQNEYMSSSGLRILLSTAKKLWSVQGKFSICQPNQVVKDILDTSGFSVILDVQDSESESVQKVTQ